MKNTKWILGGSFAFVLVAVTFWWLGQNQNKNQTWDKTVKTNNDQPHQRLLAAGDDDLIQNINNRIIAIRHKKEVKPLIKEINELANDPKNKDHYTLQLYRAVISPLAKLEGAIWRMRGFVETSGTMHLAALSYIRKFYYKDYLFGPHIIALADYLIEPSTKDLKFMQIHEMQNFLENEIAPELETALTRIQKIIKEAPEDWSMAYDSFLTTGYDPENGKVFLSAGKRWKRHIIKPNLLFLTSIIQRTLGGIKYSINYNVDDLPRFVNTVVKKSAINSIRKKLRLKGLPEPVTPLEIMAILNSSNPSNLDDIKEMRFLKGNFVNFLTLRDNKKDVAAKNLKESLNYFYQARIDERDAYTQSINKSNSGAADSYVLNPELMDLERAEVMAKLDTMISLYESAKNNKSKRIVSEVTGNAIEINLTALFTPYKDLKVFLPTIKDGFNSKLAKGGTMMDENNSTVRHEKTNQTIFAWNYRYGMPLNWPNPTFGGLLPEANNENMYNMARTISITSSISGLKDFLPIP